MENTSNMDFLEVTQSEAEFCTKTTQSEDEHVLWIRRKVLCSNKLELRHAMSPRVDIAPCNDSLHYPTTLHRNTFLEKHGVHFAERQGQSSPNLITCLFEKGVLSIQTSV